MRWDDQKESSNIEDRRGETQAPLGRGGGFSLASLPIGNRAKFFLVIAIIFGALLTGGDPLRWLQGDFTSAQPVTQQGATAPTNDPAKRFAAVVLADTEDVWTELFKQKGLRYTPATLVLFNGATRSACGFAEAAMGPFYCPLDSKVYVDLGFLDDLQRNFGASGDFARAYVIAHEVGHHVQHLLGKLHTGEDEGQSKGSNGLSVRTELQADCYAGIWAAVTDRLQHNLEPGDIEEALNAASAVGDDRLQKKMQGYVVPESFTHGTSAQRQKWFRRGYDSADLAACDTQGAGSL